MKTLFCCSTGQHIKTLFEIGMLCSVLKLETGHTWDKVFKKLASEICGRQPLKNLD